jgi:hypothetical protein
MVATLFSGTGQCAVLDANMSADGNVRFGENSWRGDDFEDQLRIWVNNYEAIFSHN